MSTVSSSSKPVACPDPDEHQILSETVDLINEEITALGITPDDDRSTADDLREIIKLLKGQLSVAQQDKAALEESSQYVSSTAIKREKALREEYQGEIAELREKNKALQESNKQLEDRVRKLERDDVDQLRREADQAKIQLEEFKRAHEDLPDRGPWLHRRGNITSGSYDDYCNEILEDAQKLLLDPNLFPSIWKERTGQDLEPEAAEAWTRVESPF